MPVQIVVSRSSMDFESAIYIYIYLAWRLIIFMLPESHELHIPTHEPDYRDWKLDPPVKIVEYANSLADVATRH